MVSADVVDLIFVDLAVAAVADFFAAADQSSAPAGSFLVIAGFDAAAVGHNNIVADNTAKRGEEFLGYFECSRIVVHLLEAEAVAEWLIEVVHMHRLAAARYVPAM